MGAGKAGRNDAGDASADGKYNAAVGRAGGLGATKNDVPIGAAGAAAVCMLLPAASTAEAGAGAYDALGDGATGVGVLGSDGSSLTSLSSGVRVAAGSQLGAPVGAWLAVAALAAAASALAAAAVAA